MVVNKYNESEYNSYTPQGYNEEVFVRIGDQMIEGLCERPLDEDGYIVYVKRKDLYKLDIDVTVIDKRRDGVAIDAVEGHIYVKDD